jgi:hypothetical protein
MRRIAIRNEISISTVKAVKPTFAVTINGFLPRVILESGSAEQIHDRRRNDWHHRHYVAQQQ